MFDNVVNGGIIKLRKHTINYKKKRERYKMKRIIKDSREVFVHRNEKGDYIYGTWTKSSDPLASIKDIKNHDEIWDSPLFVKEGKFIYSNGEYVKITQ